MNIRHLGAALASYITGAIVIYAYLNRNRFLDLAIAAAAAFVFGTALVLSGFEVLPNLVQILLNLSTLLLGIALLFLAARLIKGGYQSIRRRYGRGRYDDHDKAA